MTSLTHPQTIADDPIATLAVPEPADDPVEIPASRPLLTLSWADLRFFLTCYAVGLVFFLVMLS